MQEYKVRECGFIYPTNDLENEKRSKEKQVLKLCNEEIPFKILKGIQQIDDKKENDDKYKNFRDEQKEEDKKFIELFRS